MISVAPQALPIEKLFHPEKLRSWCLSHLKTKLRIWRPFPLPKTGLDESSRTVSPWLDRLACGLLVSIRLPLLLAGHLVLQYSRLMLVVSHLVPSHLVVLKRNHFNSRVVLLAGKSPKI